MSEKVKINLEVDKSIFPIQGFAPGNYSCMCNHCNEEFTGDKRATMCFECAIKGTQQVAMSASQVHFAYKSAQKDAKKVLKYFGDAVELMDKIFEGNDDSE